LIAIEFFDNFDRELKRLSKKFRTLPDEVGELINEIVNDPKKGIDLGGGFYKIRLTSVSKGGGKSGGFRVITYYVEETKEAITIYLTTIYDKSEEDSISKKDLFKLIKKELG
jgi:hypothetical protein